jgi:hypothetical protein
MMAHTNDPMIDAPGQDPGQSLSWGEYVAWLVERHGSLAAVANKLAENRGWSDDAASIERALRRLRSREHLDGGTWGRRVLSVFGLPEDVASRARFLGAYHSRFTDLPVAICEDLVRLWDRPPVSESRDAALVLAIAWTTCALRRGDRDAANQHLARARAARAHAPADARAELLLTEAYVNRAEVLDEVDAVLTEAMDNDDRACLRARLVDQRGYQLNRARDHAAAQRLYATIDPSGPPFARCRRCNGLAYARWRQGDGVGGAALAREAAEHAGDGGHLRLRAMALAMLARITSDDAPRERAITIARMLGDQALVARFTAPARSSR